jgi:pSer/pThr/pTyr-binding forkhead associated (FHA) protein
MAAGGGGADGPHPRSARELQAVIHAERVGDPFFVYRQPDGEQRIVRFEEAQSNLTVGRNPAADLSFAWDDEVSALHAVIERHAGELTLVDDGLSRNGSYVNEETLRGMRRLRDGDVVRFGRTVVLVRRPADVSRTTTTNVERPVLVADLSELQRAVLRELCRPLSQSDTLGAPATNQEIADRLHLSVAAVKLHLRTLFDKFEVADLPQNKKRLALARRGLATGAAPHSAPN